MVIFGWMNPVTVLGWKNDECGCGVIGTHEVVRKTYWLHVFWIPVLLLGFRHGMICEACGTWTGLSFLQVRSAMKSGQLPLDRARPSFATLRPELADEFGRIPSVAQYFDPLTVYRKRGAFDLYLKVWIGLALVVLVLFVYAILTGG